MKVLELHTPVAIIGAGPAGAAASIFLTQHNIDHILLDQNTFPRDKVCGDACSGRTTQVIARANATWLEEMRQRAGEFHPTWGMTVVAPNEKTIDIPYVKDKATAGNAKGFTVPRLIFDNFLYQKTLSPFATRLQDTEVANVSETNNGIDISTTDGQNNKALIHAKLVIAADGDKSVLRRTFLPGETTMKSAAVGLRAYYSGVTGMFDPYHIELHYLKELPDGYLWIFPLSNGRANVGIGMLSDTIRQKKIKLREVMLKALQEHPRFKHRFASATLEGKIDGWGIPIYERRQPVCGDHFLLTGDAARLVDPFSGEGVGNALFSGMLAADACKMALDNENYSAAFLKEQYENKLYSQIGPELEQNALMQRIFLRQWLFNLFFSKAFKSETLRNAVSHMFTDAEMHKQFKKPSFYLKVLFNK